MPAMRPNARPNDQPNADRTGEWLTVTAAAARLDLTSDAVRMRAKRGTIPSRKVGRRLEVLIERPNTDPTTDLTSDRTRDPTPIDHAAEPIEVAYRVAGDPERAEQSAALVPVETMLDGMRGLVERLAELAARNEALAVELGELRERTDHQAGTIDRLNSERDALAARVAATEAREGGERRAADELVDLLQEQRDALRAELDRVRTAQDAAVAAPAAPGAANAPATGQRTTGVLRWLWARLIGQE